LVERKRDYFKMMALVTITTAATTIMRTIIKTPFND